MGLPSGYSAGYSYEYYGGKGYDETFVFAPVKSLIEMADHLLGNDGCLNFFAGPTDNEFSANFNFYNVHYESTHICGTSGGSQEKQQLLERDLKKQELRWM